MEKPKRKRSGVWQFWLPKRIQAFQPVFLRVAKKLDLKPAELVRDAVLSFVAQHDEEAAELRRCWIDLCKIEGQVPDGRRQAKRKTKLTEGHERNR